MKVIITGASGMVGGGVLLECLNDERVSKVLCVVRTSLGKKDAKLEEIFLSDFSDAASIRDQLDGYDAMYYCMGVSSFRMTEEAYSRLTFDPVKSFVDVTYECNPSMVWTYVSGEGSDSTEKGNVMWARVKGRAENYMLNKGFKDAYAFRPGAIIPEKGIRSKTKMYQFFYDISKPFHGLMLQSSRVTSTSRIGQAMIHLAYNPWNKKFLENKDINEIVKK